MPAAKAPPPAAKAPPPARASAPAPEEQPPQQPDTNEESSDDATEEANPVSIGDTLDDTLHIVHKLGSGKHSTTWLARDQGAQKYRAVKVLDVGIDDQEFKIIERLSHAKVDAKAWLGPSCIRPVSKQFTLTTPDGEHLCLVGTLAITDLVGPLDASYTRLYQAQTARAIVAQLIVTVAFLHSQKVVHGDIHPQNILLRGAQVLDHYSVAQLHKAFGHPDAPSASHGEDEEPSSPSEENQRIWLGIPSDKIPIEGSSIYLSDFSDASQPGAPRRTECHVPTTYCPPELLLFPDTEVSFAADVWMLGCTIFTIFAQRPLFDSSYMESDRVLAEIVDVIGLPPDNYWRAWKAKGEYWEAKGATTAKKVESDAIRPFVTRIKEFILTPRKDEKVDLTAKLQDSELKELEAMLRSMLKWKPEERFKMDKILKSGWMMKYGQDALTALSKAEKMSGTIRLTRQAN